MKFLAGFSSLKPSPATNGCRAPAGIDAFAPDSNPCSGELLSIAAGLVNAAKDLFGDLFENKLQQAEFLQRSTELVSGYDDYLGTLKRTVNPEFLDSKRSQSVNDDVLKLYVAFDHDRDLIAGVLELIKEHWRE